MNRYYEAVDFQKEVHEWLVENFNRLLVDAQANRQ
jgi:hypothetical protein